VVVLRVVNLVQLAAAQALLLPRVVLQAAQALLLRRPLRAAQVVEQALLLQPARRNSASHKFWKKDGRSPAAVFF